jgi:hypothetical protein
LRASPGSTSYNKHHGSLRQARLPTGRQHTNALSPVRCSQSLQTCRPQPPSSPAHLSSTPPRLGFDPIYLSHQVAISQPGLDQPRRRCPPRPHLRSPRTPAVRSPSPGPVANALSPADAQNRCDPGSVEAPLGRHLEDTTTPTTPSHDWPVATTAVNADTHVL